MFDNASLVRDASPGKAVPTQADPDVVSELDATHREACSAQRRMLALIVEADRRESWRDSGAHGLAHWLSMRYGISWWRRRAESTPHTRWSTSRRSRRRSRAVD